MLSPCPKSHPFVLKIEICCFLDLRENKGLGATLILPFLIKISLSHSPYRLLMAEMMVFPALVKAADIQTQMPTLLFTSACIAA